MTMRTPLRRLITFAVAGAAVLAACGSDDPESSATTPTSVSAAAGAADASTTSGGPATTSGDPVTLRLGYFPNVTHAPALVGIKDGIFEENLGSNVKLETAPFNAGPEAVEALNADAIDASFIGPNPAINLFSKSDGEAIRIVSGTTSGGAFLV